MLRSWRDGSSVPHTHLLRQAGGTLGTANQVHGYILLCFCSCSYAAGGIVDPADKRYEGVAGIPLCLL